MAPVGLPRQWARPSASRSGYAGHPGGAFPVRSPFVFYRIWGWLFSIALYGPDSHVALWIQRTRLDFSSFPLILSDRHHDAGYRSTHATPRLMPSQRQ